MSDPRSLLAAIGATALGLLVSIGFAAATDAAPRRPAVEASVVAPLVAQPTGEVYPAEAVGAPAATQSTAPDRNWAIAAISPE